MKLSVIEYYEESSKDIIQKKQKMKYLLHSSEIELEILNRFIVIMMGLQTEKKNVISVLKYHKQEKLLIDVVIGMTPLRQQK